MSERDWSILVADILEAIEKIESYTADADFKSFVENSMMTDAVVRNI